MPKKLLALAAAAVLVCIDQVVKGVKAKLTTDRLSDSVDALKGFLKK